MSQQPVSDSLPQTLVRLDEKRAAFAGLSAPVVEALYGSLRVELTYASNAIEGNTLSPRENHFHFESLHPFFDGDGRPGRLLLNWQLRQVGFPLTIIQVEERARYLGALDQGHAGQLHELQTLVAGAVERSLDLAAGRK